jgi:hypothetical protein
VESGNALAIESLKVLLMRVCFFNFYWLIIIIGKIQPSGLAAMYVKEFDVCYFIKISNIAKYNIW